VVGQFEIMRVEVVTVKTGVMNPRGEYFAELKLIPLRIHPVDAFLNSCADCLIPAHQRTRQLFPQFHVNSIDASVLLSYHYRLGLRHTVALLGAAVALSTFALGIHWIPDIVAGVAVGIVSVEVASRLERAYLRRRRNVPAFAASAAAVDERLRASG
jgi:membrane-associated phospholipid phosphatase